MISMPVDGQKDRQTGLGTVIVALGNFSKAPKNVVSTGTTLVAVVFDYLYERHVRPLKHTGDDNTRGHLG